MRHLFSDSIEIDKGWDYGNCASSCYGPVWGGLQRKLYYGCFHHDTPRWKIWFHCVLILLYFVEIGLCILGIEKCIKAKKQA